jgi:hypothetical protein
MFVSGGGGERVYSIIIIVCFPMLGYARHEVDVLLYIFLTSAIDVTEGRESNHSPSHVQLGTHPCTGP